MLLGFGASAISRFDEGFVQNVADPTAYARAVEEGHLPAARGYRLNDEDRVRGAAIERLMCDFAVDLKTLSADEAFRDELALLRPMMADGLLTRAEGALRMTDAGRPFVRLAAAVFDSFRQGAAERFSVAV